MKFEIRLLREFDWQRVVESAHLVAFGEFRRRDMDRSDFALLAVDPSGTPSGYISCIEMDEETLYWQFGGAMPNYKGTVFTIQGYREFVDYCRREYKRVTTKIERENTTMLKMAFRVGFLICGYENFKDKKLVHLINEFEGETK